MLKNLKMSSSAIWQVLLVYGMLSVVVSEDLQPFAASCGKNFSTPMGKDAFNGTLGANCTWNIDLEKDVQTSISFSLFSLTTDDVVEVYDGTEDANNTNLAANVSGSRVGLVVVTFSKHISIKLITGSKKMDIQMAFSYDSTDCKVPVKGYSRRVISPMYLPNRGSVTCQYVIDIHSDPSLNKVLALGFSQFNVISGTVNITDGKTTTSSKGAKNAALPNDFIATGNKITVSFTLDNFTVQQTFDAVFTSVTKDCSKFVKVTTDKTLPLTLPTYHSPWTDCRWILQTDLKHSLMARISTLDLRDGADNLIITDGGSLGSRRVFEWPKQTSEGEMILSSGYQMWVRVVVGDFPGARTFKMEVQQIDNGGRLYGSGNISLLASSSTPSDVYYQLESENGLQPQVTIGTNATFYPVGASIDFYDGLQETEDNLIVTFRGDKAFFPVVSASNEMLVVARNFTAQQKFSAVYTSVASRCNAVSSGPEGEYSLDSLTTPQKLCRWTVKPKQGVGMINFRVTSLSLGANETVVIYSGVKEGGTILAEFDWKVTSKALPKFTVKSETGIELIYQSTCTGKCATPVVMATYEVKKQECGGLLTAPTGVLASPGYPDLYPLNSMCNWLATDPSSKVPSKQQLFISFTALHLSQGHSVQIKNTKVNASVNVLAKYGGSTRPKDIIVKAEGSSVVFSAAPQKPTGPFNVDMGFKAEYWKLDCGGNFTTSQANGTFSTPGYPHGVTKTTLCVWIIALPPSAKNDTVHNAVQFQLAVKQANKNMTNGKLSIYDGGSLWDPVINVNASNGKTIARTNSILVMYSYTRPASAKLGKAGMGVQLNFSVFSCEKEDQCGNGICIQPGWRCNGDNNCGDNTDELGCAGLGSGLVNSYWIPVSIILGLLFGVLVAFLIPAIYRRIKYPNYSQLRDVTAPVNT